MEINEVIETRYVQIEAYNFEQEFFFKCTFLPKNYTPLIANKFNSLAIIVSSAIPKRERERVSVNQGNWKRWTRCAVNTGNIKHRHSYT